MCLSAYSYILFIILTIASVKSHKWILNKKFYDTIKFCDLLKMIEFVENYFKPYGVDFRMLACRLSRHQ
jgi:hypothetical protein